MSRFTWIPDQGPTRTSKADVNKAKFGEGYSQRSANGINSISEVWELTFTLRTRADVADMGAFLKANKGVSNFDFAAPDGIDAKFTCDTWSETYFHEFNASMTATFERVYEI